MKNLRKGPLATYVMRLTVLTPVHIGGGSEAVLNRTRYIYDAEKAVVYIVDEEQFSELLLRENLMNDYLRYIKRNSADVNKNKNPNYNPVNLGEWLREKGFSEFGLLASRYLPVVDVEKAVLNDVRLFIRDGGGNAYIPGSSLKGALRATLIKNLLQVEERGAARWRDIERRLDAPNQKEANKQHNPLTELKKMERMVEGKHVYKVQIKSEKKLPDALRDVFRGILVSDSHPISPDCFYIARELRLSTYKGKSGRNLKQLPVYAEYLKPGTEVVFTLTVDHDFWKYSPWKDVEGIRRELSKFEKRLPDLLGDAVFSRIGDYKLSYDGDCFPNFSLGAQTGWPLKTWYPELAPDAAECKAVTRKILEKRFKIHKHLLNDKEISPRTLKLVSYEGNLYPVGLCRLEVMP